MRSGLYLVWDRCVTGSCRRETKESQMSMMYPTIRLKSGRVSAGLAFAGAMAVAIPLLLASSNVAPTRTTGAPGDGSCTGCHSGNAASTVTITFPGGMTYTPGVTQRLRVTASETGKVRWGFELTARLASNPSSGQAGDLASVDALTQVQCDNGFNKPASGCPAGAPVQFITQTSAGTQSGTANTASW